MPYSYAVYTGNGTNDQFTVSFPYIRKEHVVASVNYVSATFTWVNNSTIKLDSVPANAARVEVRRVTPVTAPLVDFADGSTLVAADLDTNALQQTYINQEQDDQIRLGIYVDANGNLTAAGQRIQNVADPTAAQDAATKNYVDTTTVASAGDTMTGNLAMGGNKVTGLGTPTASGDAATKAYADLKVAKAGDSMTGNLEMGANRITGLAAPSSATDATRKDYVDSNDSLRLLKTGGTMTGAIAMGNNKVTGLGTPTASNDATTKGYVDSWFGTYGGTYYGALAADPALDPVGAAVNTGDAYFNTVTNRLRVYDGVSWGDAAVPGSLLRWTKTAAGGETSLSGNDNNSNPLNYTAGSEQVFLNGALLTRGVDYTATTGNTITGLVALVASDVVDVLSLNQYAYGTVPDSSVTNVKVANGAGIVASKLSFTQSGTGAVARTIDSKLKDVISVLDFGAVPDPYTDSTAAIQAAIDYAESLTQGSLFSQAASVYVPAGRYAISDTLTIRQSGVSLVGDGPNSSIISMYGVPALNKDIISVSYETIATDNIRGCNIRGLMLWHGAGQNGASGACLRAKMAVDMNIEDCLVLTGFYGIVIEGGVGIHLRRVRVNGSSTSRGIGSAGIKVTPAEVPNTYPGAVQNGIDGLWYSATNVVTFTDCSVSLSANKDYSLLVNCVDGLDSVNSNFHWGGQADVAFINTHTALGLGNMLFVNTFFDECYGDNLLVSRAAGVGSVQGSMRFSNCIFSQPAGKHVSWNGSGGETVEVTFNGNNFKFGQDGGLYLNNLKHLTISDNTIRYPSLGSGTASAIDLIDCVNATVTGNAITNADNGITTSGSSTASIVVANNSFNAIANKSILLQDPSTSVKCWGNHITESTALTPASGFIDPPVGADMVTLGGSGNVSTIRHSNSHALGKTYFDGKRLTIVFTAAITVDHNVGNILLASGTSCTYGVNDAITLIYNASLNKWVETNKQGSLRVTDTAVPTNGIYLAGANNVGISTNGVKKFSVDANGSGVFTDGTVGVQVWGYGPYNAGVVGTTSNHDLLVARNGSEVFRLNSSGQLAFADAKDQAFGTTTGTKIGTSTTQKIGFWGKAPIARPTTSVGTAAFVANSGTAVNDASTFGGYTIKQVVQALQDMGLLA